MPATDNYSEEQEDDQNILDHEQYHDDYVQLTQPESYYSPNLSFSEWYSIKFGWCNEMPFPINILVQSAIWLFYGFLWIPIVFTLSDKRRVLYQSHDSFQHQSRSFPQQQQSFNQKSHDVFMQNQKPRGNVSNFRNPVLKTDSPPPPPPPPQPPLSSITATSKSINDISSHAEAWKLNGLIDLNNATVDEIASLPGIGPIQARKIIQLRKLVNGFYSLEQFSKEMSLKSRVTDQLKDRVVFGSFNSPLDIGVVKKRSRIVD